MNMKEFILKVSAAVFFGVAMLMLIAAMVMHAVLGDENFAPAVMAVAAAVFSLAAIIMACLSVKKKEE